MILAGFQNGTHDTKVVSSNELHSREVYSPPPVCREGVTHAAPSTALFQKQLSPAVLLSYLVPPMMLSFLLGVRTPLPHLHTPELTVILTCTMTDTWLPTGDDPPRDRMKYDFFRLFTRALNRTSSPARFGCTFLCLLLKKVEREVIFISLFFFPYKCLPFHYNLVVM